MHKVYLFMIICLYNPTLSLENTCKIVPMSEPFETINECLDMRNILKTKLCQFNSHESFNSYLSHPIINSFPRI